MSVTSHDPEGRNRPSASQLFLVVALAVAAAALLATWVLAPRRALVPLEVAQVTALAATREAAGEPPASPQGLTMPSAEVAALAGDAPAAAAPTLQPFDPAAELRAWYGPDGTGEELRYLHPVDIRGYRGRCSNHPQMVQIELPGGGLVWVVGAEIGAVEADFAEQPDLCQGGA